MADSGAGKLSAISRQLSAFSKERDAFASGSGWYFLAGLVTVISRQRQNQFILRFFTFLHVSSRFFTLAQS